VEAGLVDSDGDGYADRSDSHPFSSMLWDDWNSNGWNDSAEFANFDGDSQPDSSDSDPYNASLWDDWNRNGINDSTEVTNSDGDSQPDSSDSDPQNASLWEDWNHNGINDSSEPPPDYDMDDDGINDDQDSDPQNSTLWCDWNRNGINEFQEPPPLDQDLDSHPDSEDSDPGNAQLWEDWNHNGYNDSIENQFLDDDNDSRPNAFDTNPQDGTLWNDHNANGINDENEITITDTDGDGYSDDRDTHVNDANLWNDHNGNGINDELELPADRDGDSIADDQDEFPDDFDNDGLTDADEIARGSNPGSSDTDGDGLNDGEENYAGTNLLAIDTDGDGLTDYEELRAYQSDPLTPTATEVSQAPDPASAPASEDSTTATQPPASSTPADSSLTLVLLNAASPPTSPPPTSSNTAAPSAPVPVPVTTPVAELKNYYKLKTAASWALSADLADGDGDGIPNAVETLYAPMEITPDGDLDGDKVSNLEEYKAGTDLNGASAGDFDGDGISDLIEEQWPGVLSKYRYADAYEDPDADGLLTIEELNGSHGTRTKVAGLVATNPRQQCSSPVGATYNVATRTPAKPALSSQNWATSGIPADCWFSRDSVYAEWMTDGSLRRAIMERINAGTFSATSFFTKQLLFNPPLPVTFKGRLNYGSDHLPLGYVQWLQSKGLSIPPLGGRGPVGYHQATRMVTKMVMGVNGLPVPQLTNEVFMEAESPSPMPSGILTSLDASDRNPSPSDIDGDGMPNAWEARYGLNFRSPYDASMDFRAPEGASPERIAIIAARLALYKNEFGLIREFPTMYVPGGKYNQTEWTMMDRLDHDHDGLPNLLEYKINANPLLADLAAASSRDTDHDGFTDLEEVVLGTNSLDAGSKPAEAPPAEIAAPPLGDGMQESPNGPFKLVWDAPEVSATHSEGYWFQNVADKVIYGSRTHYPSGNQMTERTASSSYRDWITGCVIPEDTYAPAQSYKPLGSLTHCRIMVSGGEPKGNGGNNPIDRSWTMARAQIKAVDPTDPSKLAVLPQGARLTCLRVKRQISIPFKITDIPLGNITLTIPKNESHSDPLPFWVTAAYYLNEGIPGDNLHYLLLPIELLSDLNNDGQITSADSGLRDAALKAGASDADKEKGTEYLFINDKMSNGVWDADDEGVLSFSYGAGDLVGLGTGYGRMPKPPATHKDDDDAQALKVSVGGLNTGVVWFDHPSIDKLEFFKTKECKASDKLNITSSSPFDLSTGTLPETIYVMLRDDWAGTDQEGNLRMFVGKTVNETWAELKLPLTVVRDFGAKHFFHAARDYILENNSRVCIRDHGYPFGPNPSVIFRLCVMREEATKMTAFDALAGGQKGIEESYSALPAAPRIPAVVINGNQCFWSLGYKEDSALDVTYIVGKIADKCHGRVIRGSVMAATSSDNYDKTTILAAGSPLAGPDPIPAGKLAGPDGIKGTSDDIENDYANTPGGKYVGCDSGTWTFAAGRAGGSDALGGLSTNYASAERADKAHQMMGYAKGLETGKGCIFTATQIKGVGYGTIVKGDASIAGVPALSPSADAGAIKLFILDSGGGSLALMHIDPAGTMRGAYMGRKTNFGFPYYVNNYLALDPAPARP
jgi:hypothetical protein